MKTFPKALRHWMTMVFFLCPVVTIYAQEQATLVLWHADGTKTRVELFKQSKIYFSTMDGKDIVDVYAETANIHLDFPADNVLKVTYENTPVTGITAPALSASYRQEGERIYFDSSVSSEKIALYNSSGVSVPIHVQQTEQGMVLSLSSIPSGVYILSVNGKTSKFVK